MRAWWRARVCAIGSVAGLCLAKPVHAQPAASETPPPLALGVSSALDSARAVRGARMSVAIYVYGPGDFVFERFGHIALAVHDSTTGEDIAFNWGMFDFNQPNFLARFLTGDTKYWMAGYRSADFNASYQQDNRSIRALTLQLGAAQRAALDEYVRWNAAEENKYYRYDYYADNCATRVRDILDWVLNGQLRAPLAKPGTGRTWRNETARITAEDPLVYPGIQLALGRRADHILSKAEESFLPALLADHLGDVRIDTGAVAGLAQVPLVSSDAVIATDLRSPMPSEAPKRLLAGGMLGIALGAAVLLLAMVPGLAARAVLSVIVFLWYAVGGILGTLLLLAGTVTKHAPYMSANLTLLQVHPLLLVAAVAVTRALWTRSAGNLSRGVVGVIAILSVAGALLQLVPVLHQASGVVIATVVPMHLALALAVWRAARTRSEGTGNHMRQSAA